MFILCLHCLTDQNHNFSSFSPVFRSYADWTIETLKNIDRKIPLCVKIHPHSEKFGETKFIEELIHKSLNQSHPNYSVFGPEDDISQLETNGRLPMVITCGGTIAGEMACQGMTCITATESFCEDEYCIRITNRQEYIKTIENHEVAATKIKSFYKTEYFNTDQLKEKITLLEYTHSQRGTQKPLESMNKYFFFGKFDQSIKSQEFLKDYQNYSRSFTDLEIKSNNASLFIEIDN